MYSFQIISCFKYSLKSGLHPCIHLLEQSHESIVVRSYTGGIEIYGTDYALQHGYAIPNTHPFSMAPHPMIPLPPTHYRPNITQVNLWSLGGVYLASISMSNRYWRRRLLNGKMGDHQLEQQIYDNPHPSIRCITVLQSIFNTFGEVSNSSKSFYTPLFRLQRPGICWPLSRHCNPLIATMCSWST